MCNGHTAATVCLYVFRDQLEAKIMPTWTEQRLCLGHCSCKSQKTWGLLGRSSFLIIRVGQIFGFGSPGPRSKYAMLSFSNPNTSANNVVILNAVILLPTSDFPCSRACRPAQTRSSVSCWLIRILDWKCPYTFPITSHIKTCYRTDQGRFLLLLQVSLENWWKYLFRTRRTPRVVDTRLSG